MSRETFLQLPSQGFFPLSEDKNRKAEFTLGALAVLTEGKLEASVQQHQVRSRVLSAVDLIGLH